MYVPLDWSLFLSVLLRNMYNANIQDAYLNAVNSILAINQLH